MASLTPPPGRVVAFPGSRVGACPGADTPQPPRPGPRGLRSEVVDLTGSHGGAEDQNCIPQESILPVSLNQLSVTRSFQVPLAATEEALTV